MAKNTFATRALGDYRVTTVSDGFALAPAATLVRSTDRLDFANQWRMSRQLHTPLMRAAVLMFVVDTGATRILIDAGAGRALGPSMGAAQKNLRSAGLQATDITKVLISHPHPDHLCGISDRDTMLYPNALVYLDRSDYEYWSAPDHTYPQFGKALAPYIAAERLRLFDPGDELDAGITAIPLPGHTIGHTGFEIQSAGESALFWGDIIHDYDYQLAHPDHTFVLRDFDATRVAGEIATQQKTLASVAASHELVFAPHAPFPGAGHVVSVSGGAYSWEPAS
jgi:glyoxylase-like metal-dependent hydrolase (beta-lactamase superfamily II)